MYNANQAANQTGDQSTYPESLQLLPLYTMALQKSVVFRCGTDLRVDERSNFMNHLNVMGVESSRYFIYPRMFALHNIPPEACEFVDEEENAVGPEDGLVSLPPMQNLSAERLCSDGVFMLENSLDAFIWVGQASPSNVLFDLFGLRSIDEGGDFSQVVLKTSGSVLAEKINRLLEAFTHDRGCMPKVVVVIEGDPNSEANFFRYLVEDRASFQGGSYSYGEYMALIGRQTR
jgi:protein transport protein SEC24